MSTPRSTDLSRWADADDLVDALARVDKSQRGEIGGAVEMLLEHPDPDVREEALRVLFILWKAKDLHRRAVDALLHDEDPDVRAAAGYAVAASSSPLTRREDIATLVATVRNTEEAPFVRASAYDGLLILHERNSFPDMRRAFRPERDVDWSWIERLAQD